MGKNQLIRREYFAIRRKIIANMTSESWETIPHAGGNYEPDVTEFWEAYVKLRQIPKWKGITSNTLLLYVIIQGLKVCPELNGHITFRCKSANGKVDFYQNIDISVPMSLPVGGTMPITIHGCEKMDLRELKDAIINIRKRMKKTNFTEVMYQAALDNTLRLFKRGRFDIVLARLWGAMVGEGRVPRLKGPAKRRYYAIPKANRLTKRDIEQGTITVSNFGSLYHSAYITPTLLEIIPPQICVIGIGGLTERPGIVPLANGERKITPRKYIPFSLLLDHRALDYSDLVPFMKRLDEIFAHPEDLQKWL